MTFNFNRYNIIPQFHKIEFEFQIINDQQPPLNFLESLILPDSLDLDLLKGPEYQRILESLHLVLGISYYKTCLPDSITHPYRLSSSSANLYNQIYLKGLGELFYQNQLPLKSCYFPHDPKYKDSAAFWPNKPDYATPLLAFGGGKDSLVSLDHLQQNGFNPTLFFVETSITPPYLPQLIKKTRQPCLYVNRELDPQILNPTFDSIKGHVPISAIYAHIGVLLGLLTNTPNVIASNEQSANEGNLEYLGQVINHQWSKTSEFESLFQDFVHANINPQLNYFSLLRPFSEYRIAKHFSKLTEYHHHFSSCNRQFSQSSTPSSSNLWCNECPKCAFAFLLLSAFLKPSELVGIFGENLLDKQSLLTHYRDILGLGSKKPFECVGTFAESQIALINASVNFSDSFIVKTLLPQLPPTNTTTQADLNRAHSTKLIPTQFQLCGMESVLILGLGQEGNASMDYLTKHFPHLHLGSADQATNSKYLELQTDFDLGFRSPGLKPELITMNYTTATNWFFAHTKSQTIGVTGSKGKSTTASLIKEILFIGNKKVNLLGNIGNPMITRLNHESPADLNVIELSSYQLADIKFSPDIAVITSLFPEHLDYHSSLKHYYQAKQNILSFQTPQMHYFYPTNQPELSSWTKLTKATPHPTDPLLAQTFSTNLLGSHNTSNVSLAIAVCRLLDIADSTISKALHQFNPLPHRLSHIGTYQHIDFYDDAISTTPESTIAALNTLPQTQTLFLGGQDRGYNFDELVEVLLKSSVKNLVLFPDTGDRIIPPHLQSKFNILKTTSMSEAVDFAFKHTQAGSVCLLSCASPSYSLWENFEAKGDEFIRYVTIHNT